MNVAYEGVYQDRTGIYTNSIFQKRLELELSRYDLGSGDNVHFSLRLCSNGTDGVELVCFNSRRDNEGHPLEIGSVRIPRRAYEIYPYYPGDPLVQTVLAAVHRLAQQAVALTPRETHLGQTIG